MSLFSSVAQAASAAVILPHPAAMTMQTVYDETDDPSEKKRVGRVEDFFAAPLSTFDGDGPDLLAWFDTHFPSLKLIGAGPLPGADRGFWKSKSAYAKWREVVHRRIRTTLGLIDAKKALRARVDGWTPFLELLIELSKDHGPVHSGTLGAIRTFSDRARAAGIDPMDLTSEVVPPFLDGMPAHERDASVKALKALARHRVFPRSRPFCLRITTRPTSFRWPGHPCPSPSAGWSLIWSRRHATTKAHTMTSPRVAPRISTRRLLGPPVRR